MIWSFFEGSVNLYNILIENNEKVRKNPLCFVKQEYHISVSIWSSSLNAQFGLPFSRIVESSSSFLPRSV